MRASLGLLLILFVLFPSVLIAQDDFRGFSVNLRLGPGFALHSNAGVALGSELCIYRNQAIISAEYTFMGELNLLSDEDDVTNKIGFFYGKYWGQRFYRYQLQGGVGPVWGERMVSNRHSSFFTGGVFLKAGFKLLPTRFAAIGADIQLNINPENSDLMLLLGIDFGKLIEPE